MNPDSFFREVLESHEFRLSDIVCQILHVSEPIPFTSDNANLLDITVKCKVRRFVRKYLAKSAVAG